MPPFPMTHSVGGHRIFQFSDDRFRCDCFPSNNLIPQCRHISQLKQILESYRRSPDEAALIREESRRVAQDLERSVGIPFEMLHGAPSVTDNPPPEKKPKRFLSRDETEL